MPRSTTSAGTEPVGRRFAVRSPRRSTVAALLITELIGALLLVGRGVPPPVAPSAHSAPAAPVATSAGSAEGWPTSSVTLRDGRVAQLVATGAGSAGLLARIAAELDDAADAVSAFWGPQWRRDIVIVAAATDEQFAAVGGDGHTAATTTARQITFAPRAAAMSTASLRIVLRHELFHYAARADTAADAPRWLTEGVADYVARPSAPVPVGGPVTPSRLPTDADLDGPDRSAAYDRAWSFARFVADNYGPSTLRALYRRACGPGHPDPATAVRDTLGADLDTVQADWRRWLAGGLR